MREPIGLFLIVFMTFVGFMSGKQYERASQERREAKLLTQNIPQPPPADEYYFGQSLPFGSLRVGDPFKMSDGSTGTVRAVYHDGPKMSGVLVERPSMAEIIPDDQPPPPPPRPGDLQ